MGYIQQILIKYIDTGTHWIALYSKKMTQRPILAVLESNTFQKKSKNLWTIKKSKDLRSKQIFLKYKHTIQ